MADNNGPKVPGCKVVLVGESAVGKTCIISRFISGAFDSNVSSTNGASYASKNVQYDKLGKNLLLDVWDTAGQEKYRALTKFFYKDAKVAILVYDITRYDTFKNIQYDKLGKNLLLDVWDTAGQEKYRALTKFFYKDAKVAILVYDITRYDTFKSIKEFWYEQVKENGQKNIVIGIAGNKCDLYEKEEVNENEAREFAASIGY